MSFKLKNFLKMTVGYWDKELIHTMRIKYLADRFDDDPCDTGIKRDREMVTLIGMSHSLLWQLIPVGLALIFIHSLSRPYTHGPLFC